MDQIKVSMVKTVVMPSETLAGAEFRSTQNETHEIKTIKVDGM